MPRVIAVFKDGSTLDFDKGAKDDWCVYLTRPGVPRFAPRDVDYFTAMHGLACKYGANQVYQDFVAIYEITGKSVDAKALQLIDTLSRNYAEDGFQFALVLTTIYAGMIAEENWPGTRLGRRIKRLGIHQFLILGMPIDVAANFSRRKSWQEIARECERYGF